MTTAHIVILRRDGQVFAYQLRTGRGAGASAYFGVYSHGGPQEALEAARARAAQLGLTVGSTGRGGSPVGRRTIRTKTPSPGIRWEWHATEHSAVLYVAASWRGIDGKAKCTRYSTDRHGLEGALDLAIAARISAGAPLPHKEGLLRALRSVSMSGAPS